MNSRRLDGMKRPSCGDPADGATYAGLETHDPTPGDLSMCLGCGVLLRYEENIAAPSGLSLRPLTPEELGNLHPQNQRELRYAAQFRTEWKRRKQ